MSSLLPNLLHFTRLLHSLGVDVQAGRTIDVAGALQYIEIGRRSDFYFALRSVLIHRHQDLPIFDEAFRAFWRRPAGRWPLDDRHALAERPPSGNPVVDAADQGLESPDDGSLPIRHERIERVAPMTYSSLQVSRTKNFSEFTEEELAQAEALIAALAWDLGTRRTRRWILERGATLDFRRIARRNLRHGGEPLDLPRRGRQSKRRPLILLCDISGSMERYARILLHFVYSVAGRAESVEAFVFATALTRITPALTRHRGHVSLSRIPRQVPDWGGGTRIGDALRTFNVHWARRVMHHAPTVLLISDGWDRGDPELLTSEMGRLQRTCRRLVWLNPLLGSPEYQPLTRGMQAALPFVDDFLPVHNLASLQSLAEHLNRLPARRGARPRGIPGANGSPWRSTHVRADG